METKTTKPAAWTEQEERAIVRDYLAACDAIGRGERINKSASRRALIAGVAASEPGARAAANHAGALI